MELETTYPSCYMPNSNWLVEDHNSYNTEWTREEDKVFESALAIHDEDTPDRWLKVAAMLPGKSVFDVFKHYKELEEDVSEIEAGRVPVPGYDASPTSFSLEQVDGSRKRPAPVSSTSNDHERKKGIPWTEEEHKRFLMGLMKHGKGDWRNISRNFVITKTPTQVASHAQKYYIRQKHAVGKENKRRPSIHDITVVNLIENTTTTTSGDQEDMPNNLFNDDDSHMPSQQQNLITTSIMPNNAQPQRTISTHDPKCDFMWWSSPSFYSNNTFKFQGQDQNGFY